LSIGIHPRTKKVNRAWIPLAYILHNQRYSHLTDHSADYSCKNGDVEKSYSRFLLGATRQWRSLQRGSRSAYRYAGCIDTLARRCVSPMRASCICNYDRVQFSNPLVTSQRARIGFEAAALKEHGVPVLKRSDRHANDWNYFLGDLALPLSLPRRRRLPFPRFPYSRLVYFCFFSVSMPRASPRRISMNRRKHCSSAYCPSSSPSSEIRGSHVTLHRSDLDKEGALKAAERCRRGARCNLLCFPFSSTASYRV